MYSPLGHMGAAFSGFPKILRGNERPGGMGVRRDGVIRMLVRFVGHVLGSVVDLVVAAVWIGLTIWGNVWASSGAWPVVLAFSVVNLASLGAILGAMYVLARLRRETSRDAASSPGKGTAQ